MKKLLLISFVFLGSCKKEDPCWVCQHRVYNTTHGYTVCGERPASYFTDTLGNTIHVECRLRD